MFNLDQKLTQLISDESFVRWIKGEASVCEQQQWDLWVQGDPIRRKLKRKAELFLDIDVTNDLEVQLYSLNQRIDQAEANQCPEGSAPFAKKLPERSMVGYSRAVVVVIMLLLSVISMLYLYYPISSPNGNAESLFATVEVGYGETGLLKFSDGSNIRLNAKSSLRYKLGQFNSERVEVWLDGEGYFDITHNPDEKKREFIVHTANGEIRVLGTQFNVNTRFHKTSVVLEKGQVRVLMKDSLRNVSDERILEPGERAILTASSSGIELQKVNVGMFTAWLDGKMGFYKTSLSEIIASIEATYGVVVDVESKNMLDRKITGTIRNPDLQNLLTGLQKILDLEIKQTSKKEFMIMRQPTQKV